MGVAVRPRPVGDGRKWLLVEVCGREGRGTEEGIWLLSRPLLPDKTLSTRQHSGRTDGLMDGTGIQRGWRIGGGRDRTQTGHLRRSRRPAKHRVSSKTPQTAMARGLIWSRRVSEGGRGSPASSAMPRCQM